MNQMMLLMKCRQMARLCILERILKKSKKVKLKKVKLKKMESINVPQAVVERDVSVP